MSHCSKDKSYTRNARVECNSRNICENIEASKFNEFLASNKLTRNDVSIQCKNGHHMIFHNSTEKAKFYRHKELGDVGMTEWHKKWQELFDDSFREVHMEKKNEMKKTRRADVLIGKQAYELQNSEISKKHVDDRVSDYNKYDGTKLNWIINCDDCIDVDDFNCLGISTITFTADYWKYESFLGCDFIYIDGGKGFIYKISPNDVKSRMIDISKNMVKEKSEFIDLMTQNKCDDWKYDELKQCTLYHMQMGAGCGKTYQSIKLMCSNDTFSKKTTFIYLTKMHTAKEVIKSEFVGQFGNRKGEPDGIFDVGQDNKHNQTKQYTFRFSRKNKHGKSVKCKLIIGTIDSFISAISDSSSDESDHFKGILKNIADENHEINVSKDGTTKYASSAVYLSRKGLIVIDEAQDLGPDYITALTRIMRRTHIDIYTIGDELQSIWGDNNIHTYIKTQFKQNTLGSTIEEIKNDNIIRRFHNESNMELVNNLIQFKKFNLDPIKSICNDCTGEDKKGNKCGFSHSRKDAVVFSVPRIGSEKSVNYILELVEREVKENKYLPNNFMFIFPILTKNGLAENIRGSLAKYWKDKFENKEYIEDVFGKDDNDLKSRYLDAMYEPVVMHKSDEGKSIDLTESELSTRILSIHASKGNGCDVVFLLGINEHSLRRFSFEKGNLVYESLFHVALTRQKRMIYIGLQGDSSFINSDDIWMRFDRKGIKIDTTHSENDTDIKKTSQADKISTYISAFHFGKFKDIYSNDIYSNPFDKGRINRDDCEIKSIDWGHHVARYSILFYNMMYGIVNNWEMDDTTNEEYGQFVTVSHKISKTSTAIMDTTMYYNTLRELSKKYNNDNKITPILNIDNENESICTIIRKTLKRIKKKIKNCEWAKIPILCPYESVVHMHFLQIYKDGIFADITIMDVYSVTKAYIANFSEDYSNRHKDFGCLCSKNFCGAGKNVSSDKKKKEIMVHYEKNVGFTELFDEYKKYINDNYKKSKFKYNIYQQIYFNNEGMDDFSIFKKFDIIASSKKHCIMVMLKPQLNNLNFNDTIVDALVGGYIASNPECRDEDNKKSAYNKFRGKEMTLCIITYNSKKPIFINLGKMERNRKIDKMIGKFLFRKYSSFHEHIYQLFVKQPALEYNDIHRICIDINKNIENYQSERQTKSKKNKTIPPYITEYFSYIRKFCKHDDKKMEMASNDIKDKHTTIKYLDAELEDRIKLYIGESSKKMNFR